MVPSILGMTGALCRLDKSERDDRDAHPIAARSHTRIAAGLTIKGPETDLEATVRAAEIVHMHGLWQAPHAPRRPDRTHRGAFPT